MRVKKGDKIKLVKPMGQFTNIGEICKVIGVHNNIIMFKFGDVHMGCMSDDEADKYFEKVIENTDIESEQMFKVGDIIVLKNNIDSLYPIMKSGDKFTIQSFNDYGIVRLLNVEGNTSYSISVSLMKQFFEVEEVKNDTTGKENEIQSLLNGGRIIVNTVFDKCTIVAIQLTNGFVFVEHSACVDPNNYDIEVGVTQCIKRIIDKVWELEGYALQKSLNDEEAILLSNEGDTFHIQFDDDDLNVYSDNAFDKTHHCEECNSSCEHCS